LSFDTVILNTVFDRIKGATSPAIPLFFLFRKTSHIRLGSKRDRRDVTLRAKLVFSLIVEKCLNILSQKPTASPEHQEKTKTLKERLAKLEAIYMERIRVKE